MRSVCAYAQTRSGRASRRSRLRSSRRRRRRRFSAGPNPARSAFCRPTAKTARTSFWFHNWILLPVTIGISLLVLGLIVYIVYRFNETANPMPSRRTHNGLLEFAWTVAPALVLVVIAVPSFRLLARAAHHSRARSHAEGHGLAVALELRLSEIRGRLFVRFALCRGQGPQARPAARHHRRSRDGRPRRQGDRSRRDLAGRHPLVLGAVVRHQDRRHPRPAQQDLVQGRSRGHVLRAMLEHLRHRPRVHADQRPRRQPVGLRSLARRGEEAVRLLGSRRPRGARRSSIPRSARSCGLPIMQHRSR